MTSITLGNSRYRGANSFDGKMAYWVAYPGILTDAERIAAENALKTKYGIA